MTWHWYKSVFTPPLTVQGGDRLELSADRKVLRHFRGEAQLETRTLETSVPVTMPAIAIAPMLHLPAVSYAVQTFSEVYFIGGAPIPNYVIQRN